MTLITSKIRNQLPKQWKPRPRKSLYKEQPSGKASQCISHIEWTCQQGTAVQDTRSTETSITVPGEIQTRGPTSNW